ncbi:TetR/AcrR family transcriptional regulator [Cryptosporangium minutisporangium]|uniref:TetR/AcrR family transcriptional regulator n=1 Tax=Cryptosporangium minutisporangium TaxID=113569 RepID=A0ABP6SNU5_9ACTN
MPRNREAGVRLTLVEKAAELLMTNEPVTLRRVAAAAGTSTMAVYTHFGGMPGLLRAVRQEGFTRLGARLRTMAGTDDPVRDAMALASGYAANACTNPALYRAMFDTRYDLDDPLAADETFGALIGALGRAVEVGRFDPDTDPTGAAVELWAMAHGLIMLILTGALPFPTLAEHLPSMAVAAFVGFGDDPAAARRSVDAGWSPPEPPSGAEPQPG